MSNIAPFTVKEALDLQNAEQRMMALKAYSPAQVQEEGGFELLGEETLTKTQLRWTIDEEGNMIESEVEFKDTYTLYKGEFDTRSGKSVFGVVKCKDTSTDREYWLYVDITTERDRNNASINWIKDPIEAIASTIKMPVPHEALEIDDVYEYIQRQGDVNMGKLKPEYEGAKLVVSKSLTKQQYINMLRAES